VSEDDPAPRLRAKDLLLAGEIDAKQTKGDRFGERHMRRHLRRPVGNSEKLWKKVDGEDPWDVPGPPEAPKNRGVYASGRFVRIDKETKAARADEEASHVPAWARAAQAKRESARSSGTDDPEIKPTPTASDPLTRLQQTIAQRNAEADALRAKQQDAAERLRQAQASAGAEEESSVADIPGATRLGTGGSERASVSQAGRIRTSRGGMLKPAEVKKDKPPAEPKQRRMAAGRAPPKARQAPSDIPIEMRRPPRVDYDPNKKETIDPLQRRMAAGRAPRQARGATNDIPLEQRRPPLIDPNAPEPAPPQAPVQHRMAAGRAPPKARAKANDIPLEMRRPPRIGDDGEALPSSDAAAESSPVPAPRAEPPPSPMGTSKGPDMGEKPIDRSPSGGGGGGLDDLFGMAQQEGRVRIPRRAKKTAEPEE
jgi:hypothetical protein